MTTGHATLRHRLLEGFLLRLGRQPDAEAFVLRGGMLARQWLPEERRPALDVDVVCRLPYHEPTIRERLAGILGETVDDGVRLEPRGFRLDTIWPGHPIPGFRLFAAGMVDGRPADFGVDLTFHLPVWPDPVRSRLVFERGDTWLWTCQPQTLIGRKIQVLTELGPARWRPKDLLDVRALLARFPLEAMELGQTIERALDGYAETLYDVREVFGADGWWDAPQALHRWSHVIARPAGRVMPADLHAVVEEVRAQVRPVLYPE
ncbi:MAG: nucleotidyl transferase AbiEii/AbiGii toxin family protein [Myxococcales bacterium]|nr:nucleotidyl transferase AbiEii/AbiGii toxin family protein [Myxococcales bacterium]